MSGEVARRDSGVGSGPVTIFSAMDAASFEGEVRARLAQARSQRERFVALPAGAGFGEAIESFDRIRRPLDAARGWAGLFAQAHPDAGLRGRALELEQELAAYETELALDRGVYERLAALEPARAPDPGARRLHERALREFKKTGVDRDEATRARIRELSDELVRLGQEFDTNIIADVRSITIPEGRAGLAGLPEDWIASHAVAPDGSVSVTTDPHDYQPFILYAENAAHREQLWRAYVTRAFPQNRELLSAILARRHELATLLGRASFADYALEDKMVASGAAARAFVERVSQLAKPRMEAELAELLALKREVEPGAATIRDWERGFWIERAKSRLFGFDSQLVRPYFAYERVRDGVLATSAALYGLEFRRDANARPWHPSVECYEVIDAGTAVARLWLDMHGRAGKYKHAAMFPLASGVRGEAAPEVALVCNFPEPKGDDPGLLLHGQVTTFFHEFGHLMHHLLGGRQPYLWFSGIATEMDFVEAPSQMYEEWAWDAGVLQRFARHHATGEPIPAELVARLRAAEEYGKGLQVTTQAFFASLALAYHEGDPAGIDPCAVMVREKLRLTPFPYEEGTHFYASFGHLSGYAAGYYTYLWSLVIAKDLLSRFEGDLMRADTARAFREQVLEPGGSRDAKDLVHDFLGRDYEFAAWQRWLES